MSDTLTRKLRTLQLTSVETMNQVTALAEHLQRTASDLFLTAERLRGITTAPKGVDAIMNVVAVALDLPPATLVGRRPRHCRYSYARMMFTHLVRESFPDASLMEIASYVGLRDHVAVMHRLKQHDAMVSTNHPPYVRAWKAVCAADKNSTKPKDHE